MSTPAAPRYDDAAARRRIRHSLHESLLVEASAGTGKTSELVRRIVAVLQQGLTTVDKIVAVTFTHKAAGELKLRLRLGLDRMRATATDEAHQKNLEDALARLEEASIGTIHAFCGQLLRERPVEALVDPAFEELADQEGPRLYERAFRDWLEHKLSQPSPGLRRSLIRLAWREDWDRTPPIEQLQYAGRALIEWRDFPAPWSRISYGREAEIDTLAERVILDAQRVSKAFRPIHELAAWIQRAEQVRARDYDTLEALLIKLLADLKRIHRKGAEDMLAALEDFRSSADADLAAQVREEMRDLLDRYDHLKRHSGKLDFLDLLILARNLVRDCQPVRSYLHARFTHIFVDEFQDTDPLQAELLLLLSSDDPAQTDWLEVTPAPGKLFVVGDPKQSIYKFRRADVVLYESIRARLESRGVPTVHLTRSYRAVRPIQECVNAAFEPEMTGDAATGQAQYVPLEEHRPAPEQQPAVVALPAPHPYGVRGVTKSAINLCLPDTVAAFTEWLVRQSGWKVRDPSSQEQVPVAARHVCILFRRFTNNGEDVTRDYTKGLEARGIPHLLVGSKSFHAREEVETLRAALAAVEWPDDELSVYATLRGALFAIDDATLLKFRHQAGRLHPLAPQKEEWKSDFQAVLEALDLLAGLHRERNLRPAAGTINSLLEAARSHAAFALRPAGHQVLGNVYRICDLARGYEAGGGISFRGFVEELAAQAAKAESSEAPMLEESADGVRIMTVHAAKGLEFPVVILADMSANLAARSPERHVDAAQGLCAMRLLRCAPVELSQHEAEEQARERAEGVRVAYVAATRARDLLVIPVVGDGQIDGWLSPLDKAIYPALDRRRQSAPAPGCPSFGAESILELIERDGASIKPGLHIPQRGSHQVVWWDPGKLKLAVEGDLGLRDETILSDGPRAAEGMDRYQNWRNARRQAIEHGSRPSVEVFTASEVTAAPSGMGCEVTMEKLPRAAGRPTGKRFGTLVHAALRDVALDGGWNEVIAAVQVHARLLSLTDSDAEAAREAVTAALDHRLLRAARASKECHREWPLLLHLEDGRILEGVIDLAFLDNGVWQVVDFKTGDDLTSQQPQVQWYAMALTKLTEKPARGWLLGV